MNEMKFCQSCSMPMNQPGAEYGTEADGTKSEDYCHYCYSEGKFISDETMEEMIESCVPHMVSDEMSEESARSMLKGILPKLKRWQ
jgi:hypothetical protein